MISHLFCINVSLGGALFGELIGHEWMGFPFALVVLFICFLVLQIKSLYFFGVMILAGIFSVFVTAAHGEQEGDRKKKEKKLGS
jgi:predicted branched-subunit amino acid permease